ncbi:MAG: two-component system, OmpR family, sensor histidine kinase KdpD [Verrucomicrobiota bacterium]
MPAAIPRAPAFAPAREYAFAVLGVAAVTVACRFLSGVIGYTAISLIYLVGVLLAGMILSRGPVLLAAALSALCFNFLFIPPVFTLHIHKVEDALMFVTFFVAALAVGSLTTRLKASEQTERGREQRATALSHFAQKMSAAPSVEVAFAAATVHVAELFPADATILVSQNKGGSGLVPYPVDLAALREDEKEVAALAFSRGERVGRFTSFRPESAGTYLPIKRLDTTFGVLRITPRAGTTLTADELELLEAFAAQLANVAERDRLMQIAAQAQLSEEAERLRKALLDCVSHELKTPIAAIAAASQALLHSALDGKDTRLSRQLSEEIQQGSRRLNRIVNNLLDMTRLESAVIQPQREWCDVPELLSSAIETEKETIGQREILRSLPEDLPMAFLDFSLIEQAVAKLLANAASYTRAELPIEIAASCTDEQLTISVADRGNGLAAGSLDKIFEKFYRADTTRTGNLGLGLSIARGFVEAHGGTISARNRKEGGARFTIVVPVRTMDRASLEAAS